MRHHFVTATGTDIGKTYVTAGILRAARATGRQVCAIKPLASGYDAADAAGSDPAVLLGAMGRPATAQNIAALAPWRFAAPLAPDMAAAREGKRIDVAALNAFCEAAMAAAPDTLLIEGVGGVAVPLDASTLVADWILALKIPALLVTGTYLGSLSHTITAAEFLAARGISFSIIVNQSRDGALSLQETAAALSQRLPQPVHMIPWDLNDASFQELARIL